jgi:CHAT domain-containing protein/tetratricopeptide (TPR) repeat protein
MLRALLAALVLTGPVGQDKLDPKTDLLTATYIKSDMVGRYGYGELTYPNAWKNDGKGALKTKPPIEAHSQTIPDLLRDSIDDVAPVLDANPKNKELLGQIVGVMGQFNQFTRIVPFADRYVALGGKLDFEATRTYSVGLVRLGRTPEGMQHYYMAVVRYGGRTETFAAQLFYDRFLYSWLVEKNFKEMLSAVEAGMMRSLDPGDRNKIQETLVDLLRQAAERKDLGWFLPRMEKHWIWLNDHHLNTLKPLIVQSGEAVPESFLTACDPMFKGTAVPPEAFGGRAMDTLDRGDSEAAVRQAERGVELGKAASLGQHFEALKVFNRILRQRGEWERCYDSTLEAEKIARQIKDAPEVGSALLQKGLLLERLADFRGAAKCHGEADQIAERTADRDLAYAAKSSMARALSQAGMAAQVEPLLKEIAKYMLEHRNFVSVPEDFSNWGICLNQLEKHDAALKAFQQALAPVKEAGVNYRISIDTQITCLKGIAFAQLGLKQYAEAEQTYEKVAQVAAQAKISSSAWVWQLGKAKCRVGLKDAAEAPRLIGECLKSIETERASLKDFQQRRTLNDNKYEAYELALVLALERGDTDGAFLIAERSRARAFLDEMGSQSADGQGFAVQDLASVSKECQDVCAVVYYALPERLLAWVVSGGKTEFVSIALTPQVLREAMIDLMGMIYRQSAILKEKASGMAARNSAIQVSKRLSDMIWAPVAARLPAGKRVVIVPHRELHYVPFQALHDGTRHLIEGRELLFAPSASAFVAVGRRKMEPAEGTLLFDPILSDDPKSPFAKTETAGLQAQYPQAKVVVKAAATVPAFRELAPAAGVIHVSSHGHFNPWLPLESGLQFAGTDPLKQLLTAKDIYAMRLQKTRLIVMSACVSSVGDFSGGDEVTGLTRAFQVAGVPNVIGSLWPVENDATAELMVLFHKSLAESSDPAAALRAAQMAMIQKGAPIARWAAFELTGVGAVLPRK